MIRFLPLVGFVALGLAACGSDEGPEGPDGPDEGTLTVQAQDVSGAAGKIIMFSVGRSFGGPLLGTTCANVTADPESVSAVVQQATEGTSPCDGGAEVVFDNGAYLVNAGIYTPGSQTAERCARVNVTVSGDTTANLPAFGACN